MSSRESSVFSEDVRVLHQHEYPENQYVLRLHAPRCADIVKPGQFIHLQCDSALRMRRPYSIMSASSSQGEVEILYQVVGRGSRLLSNKRKGDILSSIGPIGNEFALHNKYTKPLLLGGGVGMPPVFFLAESLKDSQRFSPLVILAAERPFPFSVCQSNIPIAGIADKIHATHVELESSGIPARLCSKQPRPGCFEGFIHELAGIWLSSLSAEERSQVEIFACGPQPLLVAVAAMARQYGLACQLSLEEYMACALGGCAGCVVPVVERGDVKMKRVCVDGPVFYAGSLNL